MELNIRSGALKLRFLSTKLFTFLLFLILIQSGCGEDKLSEKIDDFVLTNLIPVISVSIPEKVKAGKAFTVKVEGLLPGTHWKFERLFIKVTGDKVIIKVYGKGSYKKGEQKIIPFTAVDIVPGLPPGKYRVEIISRTGKIIRELEAVP